MVANLEKKSLITKKEEKFCRQVAAQDKNLASQRANALLAINEGVSRTIASESSGLTPGQIQYLLKIFKNKRLAIFPDYDSKQSLSSEKKKLKAKKKKDKANKKKSVKEKKKDKSKKNKSEKEKSSKKKKKTKETKKKINKKNKKGKKKKSGPRKGKKK
jgi:hypothetical protein